LRQAGFLSTGYLREVAIVSLLLTVVLGGLESLEPEPESAANTTGDVLPIYQVGFSGDSSRIWCHRWGHAPEEFSGDESGVSESPFPEALPFPQMTGAYSLARSAGPVITTAMADAVGRFMIARDSKVHIFLDQPYRSGQYRDVCVTQDGKQVYSLHFENGVLQWQWNGQSYEQTSIAIAGNHERLQVSPRGKYLAVMTNRNEVVIWDLAQGLEVRRYVPHPNRVSCIAWSADESCLASCGDDGHLRMWDAATGQMQWQAVADSLSPMTITFSPHGKLLATGGFDQQVSVWNAHDGSLRERFSGHTAPVRAVAFDAAGERLLSAGLDGRLMDWSLRTAQSAVQIWPPAAQPSN